MAQRPNGWALMVEICSLGGTTALRFPMSLRFFVQPYRPGFQEVLVQCYTGCVGPWAGCL